MALNLDNLNPQQKEAVLQTKGPVLIIAGAGTGKTQCLTYRLAYLIEKGVKPENILALTFTNKAAEEMKNRVKKLIGGQKIKNSNIFVGTFHSFGAKIMRQEMKNRTLLEKNSLMGFTIFDDDDSLSLIKKIIKKLNLDSRQFNPSIIKEKISGLKAELISASDFELQTSNFFEKTVLNVYQKYQEELNKNNAFDFDDLIAEPVYLFKKDKKIIEKYQNQYRYILIDEYQDTNHAQYILTRLLAEKYRNLCVVGDDQQSIYAWRKADFRNILNFEKDFPEAKIVILEKNYRSTANILKAANAVIENNVYQKKKNLWTENTDGQPLCVVETNNEKTEAYFVSRKIKELMEAEGIPPQKFSILYRINAQSRPLEEALIKRNIPYQIIGGIKFYQRREIKDVLSILRLIINPCDTVAEERLMKITAIKKNLPETLKILRSLLKENRLSLWEFIKFVIKKTDYESYLEEKFEDALGRQENIRELLSLAKNYEETDLDASLSKFLEIIALYQESDSRNERKNSVNLMTVHSAKGLEFHTVFIIGLEEGLFPHSRSLTPEEIEEERRLAYVAITRAQNKLFLSYTNQRLIFGSVVCNYRSRFIEEIPLEITDTTLFPKENSEEYEVDESKEENWIEY